MEVSAVTTQRTQRLRSSGDQRGGTSSTAASVTVRAVTTSGENQRGATSLTAAPRTEQDGTSSVAAATLETHPQSEASPAAAVGSDLQSVTPSAAVSTRVRGRSSNEPRQVHAVPLETGVHENRRPGGSQGVTSSAEASRTTGDTLPGATSAVGQDSAHVTLLVDQQDEALPVVDCSTFKYSSASDRRRQRHIRRRVGRGDHRVVCLSTPRNGRWIPLYTTEETLLPAMSTKRVYVRTRTGATLNGTYYCTAIDPGSFPG